MLRVTRPRRGVIRGTGGGRRRGGGRFHQGCKAVHVRDHPPAGVGLPDARWIRSSGLTTHPFQGGQGMTKTQLIEQVAKLSGLEKKQAKASIEGLTKLIENTMKKGGQVPLAGLGKFKVVKRKARMGRNPATGDRKSTRLNS